MVASKTNKKYQSWGRYPKAKEADVEGMYWTGDTPDFSTLKRSVLPFGYGRSYGDSCLNNGGILIDTSFLQRFLAFDEEKGLLRCEAGVSFAEILQLIVPLGWFLPVTPGTKYVSVAGAIANDVHGKNHHRAGTFGCHVTQFELLRSDGQRLLCSPTENIELFRATIGGLGLTGLITWAEFRLKKIINPFFETEQIRFSTLDEFFELSTLSDTGFEYTVSWSDCLIQGKNLGRGFFIRGNHDQARHRAHEQIKTKPLLFAPFDAPALFLNPLTMKLFTKVLYHKQLKKRIRGIVHYNPFFYPLDFVKDWNRLYGKPGFLQYQFVVPHSNGQGATKEIFARIARSGEGSFLAVLKKFGDVPSPGMMSFPRPGITLAVDFAFHGQKTLKLLNELDQVVQASGGAVYPAKDARMSAESFQAYYPQWQDFAKYIDPHFSSTFWKRVTKQSGDKNK